MALNFSEGLLSGLRTYGQRQQPRQQRGASGGGMLTPAPQPFNIGELFAQNLGRSGIVAGVDMRTPLEKLQEDLGTIPQDDPERQLKMANIIASNKNVPVDQRMAAVEMAREFREKQLTELEISGSKKIVQVLVAAGPDQMGEPYVTSSVAAIADEHGVTGEELAAAYEDARTVFNIEDADKQRQATKQSKEVGTARDAEGNLFSLRNIYDPNTDTTRVAVTPMGHTDVVDGQLTLISTTTGLSGMEIQKLREDMAKLQSQLDIGEEVAKDWDDRRRSIIQEGITSGDIIPKVNDALEIARRIETGGMQANFEAIKGFFGKQAANAGEFNTLAGDFVLTKLATLTGAISDKEKDFIEGLVFGLKQSPEVNVALLERILRELKIPLDRATWLADNPDTTENEYDVRVLRDIASRAIPTVPVTAASQ